MSDSNVIRSLTPSTCPHCDKDFYIASSVFQPTIDNLITPQEVKDAKKKFLERMEEIEFKDENERELAEKWVKDDKTVFGLGDLEPLLKTMAISQLNDKTDESSN